MSSMKILFLDCDGVVNCSQSFIFREDSPNPIDKDKADLVRYIIQETGCYVVLSSSWRLHTESRAKVIDNICPILDVTPYYPADHRGREVRLWLQKNPQVVSYAILDDDSDFDPAQHLFKTKFTEGLTPEIADKVIEHLGRKPNKLREILQRGPTELQKKRIKEATGMYEKYKEKQNG